MKINGIECNWKAVDSDGTISYHVDRPCISNCGGDYELWRSKDYYGEVGMDYEIGLTSEKRCNSWRHMRAVMESFK